MMDRGQAPRSGGRYTPRTEAYENSHFDEQFDEYREDAPRGARGAGRFRLFAHGFGTLLSLAVIGFGGYWGYKQIMRDVHGVPVVRALEGPVRIAPEDPGGMVASNAGLSVNDVQAVGTASAPEDRLTLAPATIGLTAEDLPVAELSPPAAPAEGAELATPAEAADAELIVEEEVSVTASLSGESLENVESAKITVDDDAIARAIAMATADAEPLSGDAAPGAEPDPAAAGLSDDGGVQLSPRPPRRPARSAGAAAMAVPAQDQVVLASASAPAALEASAVPAGTRLVQLGAFDTAEEARVAWTALAGRFGGLMADKTQVIAQAGAGESSFWRLRAMGFADLSDARRFCAALVAERADCIPVVAR